MNKIVFFASLILISIIKSTEDKPNNSNKFFPNIFDENIFDAELSDLTNENIFDAELMDLADRADSLAENRSESSALRGPKARSRLSILKTPPSGRKSTPSIANAQGFSSPDLLKMTVTYNAFKDFKASASPSPRSLSQAVTPEKKFPKFSSFFSAFDANFTPVEKENDKNLSNFGSQQTNWLRLSSESTPKIIYSPSHIYEGSKGGGKHHFQHFEELLAIADLKDKNLPFVKNNKSNQLMGIISTGKVEDATKSSKTKFSSIFPLDQSPDDINKKLISLDFQEPYGKGKIFGKSFQNNSLIMRFDNYFILIDLDSTKLEGLQDLFVSNSFYPLFHLKAITEEDLSTPGKLIDLVNYSILQEDSKWSENFTAQITSEELNHFLQRALSSEEFKKYALACSADNILINMPYNFATNEVNLEFETHGQNLQKNMYRITLEIPKSIAYKFNPKSTDYCSILTS